MASIQKMGGIAIYFDTEGATNDDFLQNVVGIDFSKNFMRVNLYTVQEIFETMQMLSIRIREKNRHDLPVLMVVDSIANATTKTQQTNAYDKNTYQDKPRIISTAFRKITPIISKQKITVVFTNQLKVKLNAMPFSDPYTTPGGLALRYLASNIVRLSKSTLIRDKDKQPIGMKIAAKIVKSRFGGAHKGCDIPFYFDTGIDDYQAWMLYMRSKKLIESRSVNFNGQKIGYNANTFANLLNQNDEVKQYLYNLMADHIITKYNDDQDKSQVDKQQIEYSQQEIVI